MEFYPGCQCCGPGGDPAPGSSCEFCDIVSKAPIYIELAGFVDDFPCSGSNCNTPFSCLNGTYEFDTNPGGDPPLIPTGATESNGNYYFDCDSTENPCEGGGESPDYNLGEVGGGDCSSALCTTYKAITFGCVDLSSGVWDDEEPGWYFVVTVFTLPAGVNGARYILGSWIFRIVAADIAGANTCDPLDVTITDVYRYFECGAAITPTLEPGVTVTVTQ